MGTVYIIHPEDKHFLANTWPDPILQSVVIQEITVDTAARRWTILLSGRPVGTEQFWESLRERVHESIGGVAEVVFRFADAPDDYMDQVIKNFPGPEVVKTVPENGVNGNGGSNGGSKGRGRRRGRTRLTAPITSEPIPIADITEEEQNTTIRGQVIEYDKRVTRTGKLLVTLALYDGTDSIGCKLFVDDQTQLPAVKKGDWLTVTGDVQYQSYDSELSLLLAQMNACEAPSFVADDAPAKRIEFHLHTKMSGMDGTIDVEDAVRQAASWGHDAIAITDHGVIQAFPEAYAAGRKYGIRIIYGLEGYLVEGDKDRPYHIIVLAANQTGLRNLYKLVSFSHMEHFYRRPRLPRSLLEAHRDGLILGSACEAGEVYQAVLRESADLEAIASFYDYLEIQPIGNNSFLVETGDVSSTERLQEINRQICSLGSQLSLPVVATGDVHFLRPENGLSRTILLTGQGFEDAERQAPLYFRTTEEMLGEFAYLGDALAKQVVVDAPNQLAATIEDLTPVPQGLYPPRIEAAPEKLRQMAYQTAHTIYGEPLPDVVEKRLERELDSIIGNGYAPLYWIAHKLVTKSLKDGYLVGSRGSVGSSLVATLSEITEVNPLPPHYVCAHCRWTEFITDGSVGAGVDLPDKQCPRCAKTAQKLGFDIPFEVFMGFHGDKVPDIDLNFSGEYQTTVHRYCEELFGKEHVFRAGTIGTLADKTAYGFVKKYFDHIGVTKRSVEINRMVKTITGVRRTTGQHPGGMMVVPDHKDIYEFTPIQYPANDGSSGIVTTHFDYHAIHDSLVKLDILGHDDPTMLRMLGDITGVDVTRIPLDDSTTMGIFSGLDALGVTQEQIGTAVGTLGVPEFGTRFVRQMLIETRPKTFSELVRISGLSHGTNVWTSNAQELISQGITDLTNVIACRDDIMAFLLQKGIEPGDAFRIMEQVRKGKGLEAADEELMRSYSVPQWYVDSCQKITYMFPKAHAVAYVMMAFRVAYFKVHHPAAYYASYFTVRADEFDAHLVIQGEQRIREEIATIESKGNETTAKERNVVTVLEIVLEAMARGIRFAPVDLMQSDKQQFCIRNENTLLAPFVALQGLGASAAANIVEARASGEFLSVEDLRERTKVTKTVVEVLRDHQCLIGLSETNQLSLF